MTKKIYSVLLTIFCVAAVLVGCVKTQPLPQDTEQIVKEFSLADVPEYSGKAYVEINGNRPYFTQQDITTQSFESYTELDSLGRCGVAIANVGKDIMPTQERGSIGQVKPSGWQTVKYDCVDGKYLYNRCHLIGYQLTGENANKENLITGTRYLNVDGMLPFENMVADYVKETENHVMYRVTPVFYGDNLVANGVLMEAYSVEDEGDGVEFCVYVYNVQPGVEIDYATGNSWLVGEEEPKVAENMSANENETHSQIVQESSESNDIDHTQKNVVYITKSGKKYHKSKKCASTENAIQIDVSDAISKGYEECSKCRLQ